MLKTSYDPTADAMFVWLARENAVSADTREVAPGIMLDYDKDGNVIGIEILDVRSRVRELPPAQVAAE
ncbi:DUF2283 domain-containing protein [Acidiphilium sp. AL]|nr:DUF2283 domain-containing protein [Acidiphilium sp. AL]